jgi:flagellin
MAASAAGKARHGMNESIARLSTGVRGMFGGDAAGLSVGLTANAQGKSYAAASRNLEQGISYLQTGESVLFEVANLLTRLRELGVANDNAALLDATQEGSIDAEVTAITAAVDAVLDNTTFNGVEVIDSNASKSVNIAYNGTAASQTHTAGPGVSVTTIVNIQVGDTARATADTALSLVASALGNIAADLTALKSMQNVANATSANLVATGARVLDTDFALETAALTKNSILNQAAMAMSAQANQAQSAILSVLQ